MNNPFTYIKDSNTDDSILDYIHKSKEGLVLVKKPVQGKSGRMYIQGFWIRPDDLKIMGQKTYSQPIDDMALSNKLPNRKITGYDISKLSSQEKDDLEKLLQTKQVKLKGRQPSDVNTKLANLVNKMRTIDPTFLVDPTKQDTRKIKTLDDIHTVLKKDYGWAKVSKDLMNLDEETTVNTANHLCKLEDIFHLGKSAKMFLSANPKASKTDAFAYAGQKSITPEIHALTLVPKYFKQPGKIENSVRSCVKNGWFNPCTSDNYTNYIVTHEYGHLIQFDLFRKVMEKQGYNPRLSGSFHGMPTMVFYNKANDIFKKVGIQTHDDLMRTFSKMFPGEDVIKHIPRYPISYLHMKRPSTFRGTQADWNYEKEYRYKTEVFAESFANAFCGKPNKLGLAMREYLKNLGYKVPSLGENK